MVCFQTKNPNLGKFWRVLHWKRMLFFMDTWSILQSFVIFYVHLVKFMEIWYILPRFGILYQEKSGNPGCNRSDKVLVFITNNYDPIPWWESISRPIAPILSVVGGDYIDHEARSTRYLVNTIVY
jgi:hypothetical protein